MLVGLSLPWTHDELDLEIRLEIPLQCYLWAAQSQPWTQPQWLHKEQKKTPFHVNICYRRKRWFRSSAGIGRYVPCYSPLYVSVHQFAYFIHLFNFCWKYVYYRLCQQENEIHAKAQREKSHHYNVMFFIILMINYLNHCCFTYSYIRPVNKQTKAEMMHRSEDCMAVQTFTPAQKLLSSKDTEQGTDHHKILIPAMGNTVFPSEATKTLLSSNEYTQKGLQKTTELW